MELERKLLKISGILYAIMGVLLIEFPILGVFLILSGIYFFVESYESEEKIYKNRVFSYILASIGLINIIGAILVYISMSNIESRFKSNPINAPPKVVYKQDKETKKIDILLKLGVGMVFVSGLLFATTTWSFVNDFIKVIALVAFGGLFLALSIFTEQRLKLYRSSYMYWILGMLFFILTIVGILYLGVFSNYLSYFGSGKHLAYVFTFLAISGFSFTTYLKFPKNIFIYIVYISLTAALVYLLLFFNLSETLVLAIISFVLMIINIIIRKNNSINIFSKIMTYVLFAFLLVSSHDKPLDTLIACIINIINLNYLVFTDKEKELSMLSIIPTYILIIIGISSFTPLGNFSYIMTALTITVYSLLINGNVLPAKEITKKINYVIYLFITFIIFVMTMSETTFSVPSTYVIISIILLVFNTIIKFGLFRVDKYKLANYIQPFIILCVIDATVEYLGNPIIAIYELAFISIVYCILHFAYKNKLDRNIMFVYLVILLTLSFGQPMSYNEIYACLILVISSLYLFTASYVEETKETFSMIRTNIGYITLLSSLYIPFVLNNILEINLFVPALVFIILVLIMAPLLNNKWIKRVSYIYLILPLLTLINYAPVSYDITMILESVLGLYIVYLINKLFIKNDLAKCILTIIGLLLFCTEVFFINSLYVAIYIGIVGIIATAIGYKKDSYTPIFITGIIITIINIIYRLKEVWKLIPFWLYLLVGGLLIIGFVTYRELKKQNKSK